MDSKKEIVKEYSNDDLTVVWKPNTCIHSKLCWKGLLQVFNPQNRPWINMDGASSERIKKQVEACPSGALSIKTVPKNDNMENDKIKISVAENGPLLVNGTCEITKADGSLETKDKVTAFCRCGASSNKPYCDGQHRKINFIG
ncbi:(4Fe-4S)-binding protein [Aureibaculum sp. 2210JD6-5]|uniref:(4Fe-4S)-binding protein n=1 Tax=Aureibaculum sp. 2210JD6-5 TaxID=3103957 RepID=UPI002AAC9B4B|nr:(4Fe-4S)-binding protein [Aureibaculum sp. 2210JD6-5]MDY7394172.1 (4Fe-4S)-binding protein [Aureibaculum sp. 2210JD6-5]